MKLDGSHFYPEGNMTLDEFPVGDSTVDPLYVTIAKIH